MTARRDVYAGTQLELPVVQDAAEGATPIGRARVRKDASDMTAEELLTLLLGHLQASACTKLAASYKSFRDLAAAHPLDWRDAGLTRAGVERLAAIFDIARRFGETEWLPGAAFRGSADVYAHFRERMAAATREEFYGVLLDNKHRKLRDVLLSLGSLTASIVHPRLCVATHKRGYVAARLM